MNTVASSKFSF